MILIISTGHDPHCDIVERVLDARSAPYIRFSTEDYPRQAQLHINLADTYFHGTLVIGGREIDLADISAIWYRRPLPPVIDDTVTDVHGRNIALAESQSLLRQLWAALADRYWMSWPLNLRRADQKLLQLRVAQQLGFQIPKTTISTNGERLRTFFDETCGNAIVKTVSGVIIEGPPIRALYTVKLDDQHLEALPDGEGPAPVLFQEYVNKAVELRVTVVGDRLFAAEMETQIDDKTRVDWRRGSPLGVPHRAVELPPETHDRCLQLVKRFGLTFGALDLIRTENDQYVFLEINPNGQWAWIEGLTGMPISEAIADELIKGKVDDTVLNRLEEATLPRQYSILD